MAEHRVYSIPFSDIHRLYQAKVERKGRTREELDEVLGWLTGYSPQGLEEAVTEGVDLRAFFDRAPEMNPHRDLITGSICGVKIVEIEDPLMKQIRQMDKVVDELARGRAVDRIKRTPKS